MRWSPTIALAAAIAGVLCAPAASQSAELLQDGGFEGGRSPSPWVQADNRSGSPICSREGIGFWDCWDLDGQRAAANNGNWWAWFGGFRLIGADRHVSSLRQSVTLTPGTPATLSFWLWIGRADQASVLNVSLGGTTLFAVRGDDTRYHAGYTQVVVPVSGSIPTGVPQTLSFEYEGAAGLLRYPVMNVDDVSLQVADSDLGVGLASTPGTVTPGTTFITTLAAGNAGPQTSDEVEVQYPLPAGATLVGLAGDAACSAPDTTPGHVVHCDFGTVPAGATKAVSLALHADAVGTISQAAVTTHRTGDPNAGNNVAHSAVTVVPASAPPPPPGDRDETRDPDEPKVTCTTPRRFTVPLRRGSKGSGLMIGSHRPASARITSARISGPRKFKAQKLKHTRSRVTLDLRRVPAGRYSVRTRVRVSSKRTISVNKTYTVCEAAASDSTKRAKTKKPTATSAKATKAAKR